MLFFFIKIKFPNIYNFIKHLKAICDKISTQYMELHTTIVLVKSMHFTFSGL